MVSLFSESRQLRQHDAYEVSLSNIEVEEKD
jgi:hypothetical protein